MKLPAAPVRIMVVAGTLVLGLVGVVVREGQARADGQEVRLAMAGYDPRSLLSGHYVQFQLRHDLPTSAPCPSQLEGGSQRKGKWVALRRDGARHVPVGSADTREAALGLAPTVVRGVLVCASGLEARLPTSEGPPREVQSLMLDIGIDRIHLDQDEAEAMERQLRRFEPDSAVEADAIVSIGRDGKARLVGVEVGGKRTDLDWF